MLIKRYLKIEQSAPCPITFKLKKQPFPLSPTCKKQNGCQSLPLGLFVQGPGGLCKDQRAKEITGTRFPLLLYPKIEQALLESLSRRLSTERGAQKENKLLRYLYPINFFSFQKKYKVPEPFTTHIENFSLIKKESYACVQKKAPWPIKGALVRTKKKPLEKEKGSQLKIILKSYSSQLKDIEISITAIFKLIHYLDNCCVKQFETSLINSFYLASFNFYSSFFNLKKTRNFNNFNDFHPGVSSTFSLLGNRKIPAPSLQKKQKAKVTQMLLNLDLLIGQPLSELLGKPCKVGFANKAFLSLPQRFGLTKGPSCLKTGVAKQAKEDYSAFLLLMLQKTNYCNRYFFKSSVFLNNNGPTNKQAQKTLNSTKLFTVIRSPFVFKKTREQFIKKTLSYSVTIELHSPIQKQFFIQCLGLLRLPVELEVHC